MAARDYVVGLPVVVSVDDDGFVEVEVDLSELPSSIWEFEGENTPDDDTIRKDQQTLDRWTDVHTVQNEGFAPTEKENADG